MLTRIGHGNLIAIARADVYIVLRTLPGRPEVDQELGVHIWHALSAERGIQKAVSTLAQGGLEDMPEFALVNPGKDGLHVIVRGNFSILLLNHDGRYSSVNAQDVTTWREFRNLQAAEWCIRGVPGLTLSGTDISYLDSGVSRVSIMASLGWDDPDSPMSRAEAVETGGIEDVELRHDDEAPRSTASAQSGPVEVVSQHSGEPEVSTEAADQSVPATATSLSTPAEGTPKDLPAEFPSSAQSPVPPVSSPALPEPAGRSIVDLPTAPMDPIDAELLQTSVDPALGADPYGVPATVPVSSPAPAPAVRVRSAFPARQVSGTSSDGATFTPATSVFGASPVAVPVAGSAQSGPIAAVPLPPGMDAPTEVFSLPTSAPASVPAQPQARILEPLDPSNENGSAVVNEYSQPRVEEDNENTVLSNNLVEIRQSMEENHELEVPQEQITAVFNLRVPMIKLSTGARVPLDRTVLIGRAPEAARVPLREMPRLVNVASPNNDVSRTHAQVRAEGEIVLVTDLNSTNGVFLIEPGASPRRLHPDEPVQLEPGVVVDLGDGATFILEDEL